MPNNVGYDYDNKYDSLFVYNKNRKAYGTLDLDEIYLDYDKKLNIVGIEIMNASNFLSAQTRKRVFKKDLARIEKVKLSTEARKGFLLIKLLLEVKKEKELAQLPATLTVQNPKYRSPATKIC